jgi:hypothetical protein
MSQSRATTTGARRQRLGSAAEGASKAVRQAATVLEGELASGLSGVRRIEARFSSERRVEPKEFDEVLQRLRVNVHEFIDLAAGRIADLRSDEVQNLSKRLTTDAHDLFDTMINLVGLAPDVINRLAAKVEAVAPAPPAAKTASRKAARRPAGRTGTRR